MPAVSICSEVEMIYFFQFYVPDSFYSDSESSILIVANLTRFGKDFHIDFVATEINCQ